MLALLFLSLSSLAIAKEIVTENFNFVSFMKVHHPNVREGSSEFIERQELFATELKKIEEHNNDKNSQSYKLGINKFSASYPQEKRKVLGRLAEVEAAHKPERNHIKERNFEMKPVSELPSIVDWRSTGMATATKDQGHCGSCFAFAAAEMLESYLYMSSGLLYNLSPQMGASCTPNPEHCGGSGGCSGGTAEIIFDDLANGGGIMAQEYQYGYVSYDGSDHTCNTTDIVPTLTVEGYHMLTEGSYDEMMNAVAQVGPISIGVDASEWHNYAGGVFNGCNQKNPDVNHAVVLYGYGQDEETGEKYWLIRNSWSPSFGEKGYIRIHRDDNEAENCGIQLNVQDNDACEGDFKPRKVCGTCGILSGSSYLQGVKLYA